MKLEILEYLICPACLPEEISLRLGPFRRSGSEIIDGVLECRGCGRMFPIERGVARLTEVGRGKMEDGGRKTEDGKRNPSLQRPSPYIRPPTSVYESAEMLSAYLWSHYADLFDDPDATGAYPEWAAQIEPTAGAALDAGCATGRFCFEMSCKYDFVVGVDLSENFISAARRIMEERRLKFQVKEEGRIHSERAFILPPQWDPVKVEFIVADANALPFRSGSFACVASLNLIDKIARPLEHISETSRTARPRDAQLLISDPFSWSEAVCAADRWLGGAPGGSFAGHGIDNVARLLSGEAVSPHPQPPREETEKCWKIARRGAVWWKIRHHRNYFELIRSLFVKAER